MTAGRELDSALSILIDKIDLLDKELTDLKKKFEQHVAGDEK